MEQQLNNLFQEWKEQFSFHAFISDGIVDHSRYENPHVLFILRDMNCNVENDLCENLRTYGSGHKTWCNAGRWVQALLDGEPEYPYDMSSQKRAQQLSRIAVMNLKKEGGSARAVDCEITDAVYKHRKFILREISLCDPDIIICCGLTSSGINGTADRLYHYVFEQRSEWRKFPSEELQRDWWYYEAVINDKKIPVISFCHPQVTNLGGKRGHEDLFKPLYNDMLTIRKKFLRHE